MTRGSVLDYAEAVRPRYRRADRRGKGLILDEFVQVTGYHRKAAIRLLCRAPVARRAHGRAPTYGAAVLAALRVVWEAMDRIGSKRLQPFLPELLPVLERHGRLRVTDEVRAALLRLSPATIDRLLRPARQGQPRRPLSTTKPGTLLKGAIPIRTFADWDEGRPGFLEVDLVAHCGESTEGFYLCTLSAVDVATGWVECEPVWGKGQARVGGAIHRVRQQLPIPLLGLDSDNGSEFINHGLYDYCQRSQITFTRSRPYKQNDAAHVEQKNWTVVRRQVGYDRYSSKAAYAVLGRLYGVLRLYVNYFQPVRKLVRKRHEGAKVRKVYDRAQTPYRRLVASGALTTEQVERMEAVRNGLDPVRLKRQIDALLDQLWRLADRPIPVCLSNTRK